MNARLRCLVSFAAIGLLLSASPALRAADGSVSFDGTGQHIFVPNFQNAGVSGEVTVEFWAKTNATAQQAAFMLFPDQPANRFMGSISYINGNTYWDCGDINGPGRLSTPNPEGSVGNWTHYAFVSSASGGFMKIYVNGAEVASKTGTFSAFNPAGNGATGYGLYIGGGSGFALNGSLDEFRIWNVARTQWQIQTSLGADLTGSEAGLRLYYKFDEGSGNLAANSATATGAAFNGTLTGGVTRSTPARLIVSSTNDSGAGSLRQAVTDAALSAGASYITFAPALSGQTITLNSTIGVNDISGPVTIDASSLPGGLTLDGSGGATAHSIFYVASDSVGLTLEGLRLAGASSGAIRAESTLTLTRCSLFGNSSTSDSGGAIDASNMDSTKVVTLTSCTLSGNTSSFFGGAIYAAAIHKLELTHCTISGNTANNSGGGIHADLLDNKKMSLKNCIVAGNTLSAAGNGTDNIGGSATFTGSNNLTSGDPLLSPLGYYGGSTMTMLPLPGSPAIDAGGVIAGLSTDQRGFAYNVDGNASGGAQPDIGAVEVRLPVKVTTTVDERTTPSSSGAGLSLREAVLDSDSDYVSFDSALSGQTIRLTLGTEIVLNQSVSIDASNLPAGLTVDGISSSGDNRLFTVSAGQSVVMTGLTLTGGTGAGAAASGSGGAILNLGTLTLNRCTLAGNKTGLTGDGGAIATIGLLKASQCTFYDNRSSVSGGAIRATFGGSVELVHCTVSANSCVGSAGNGGGVAATASSVRVANSIIWGNSVPLGSVGHDLYGDAGQIAWVGANFVQFFVQTGATVTGPVPLTANPLLGQLGNYGGPTRTMLPKAGSPAINAAVGSTITTDQRGLPIWNDTVVQPRPDIGAAERRGSTDKLTVTTTADELNSPNNAQTSLREAITDGAAAQIVFASALSGGTITLESSRGEIAITQGVSVDATSLPKGLTLHGGTGVNRIFNITSPGEVVLKSLTFTSGDAGSGAGGAILAGGSALLAMERCTFTGNNALEGGAIFTTASQLLTLDYCTFSGNTGGYGGALQCLGYTAISNCTISGNHGSTVSGGIFNKFTTAAKPLAILNSIISGNSSPWPDGDDIYTQSGVIWILAANIVGSRYEDTNSSVVSGSTTPLTSDPLLGPLRDYGGPTQTMALKPGSPALNAAIGSSATSDQRGYPIVGVADIGAYEAGTIRTYNSWTWENQGLYLLPNLDNDSDGLTNLQEYGYRTDPRVANYVPVSPPSPNTGGGGGSFAASFSQEAGESEAAAAPPPTVLSYDLSFHYNPEATDLRYIFQRSSDLSPTGWTDIYTYDSTTGLITEASGVTGDEVPGSNVIYITDSAFTPARTFWRLVVEQP